ncbi:MAG: ABC transporter ATP-binding protein [Candidatus Omnitrophica bacterium]|nr:ABC transporter ATP-binding protein [Candidatus Omnitrophota bacterium]MCM8816769.1 ABC transporter ATP-binding protein [Candidatus Omnitrophota bacterium]
MQQNDSIITFDNVTKVYHLGGIDIPVLRGISCEIKKGEHVAIMGPSGSGKTTMLNIIGCLDRVTSGRYLFEGKDISSFDDDALSEVRQKKIGFIFQSYNLIPQLTVLENIEMPLFYQHLDERKTREKAMELAKMVGLGDRIKHKPSELSGGQQQRVAIARALMNNPLLILADEPTGNLDSVSGREIMKLLCELNEKGTTLIVVTHDAGVAKYARRIIRMLDGKIVDEN